VRVWSEALPITTSMMASENSVAESARATTAAGTPIT
jgi:hypothetical protein